MRGVVIGVSCAVIAFVVASRLLWPTLIPATVSALANQLAGAGAALASRGSAAPAPPAAPSPTTPSATAATPTRRAGIFRSGGLGLTREEWERLHGAPSRETDEAVEYENGRFVVAFRDGRVARLTRVWGEQSPALLDAARIESRTFLPRDARFVRSRIPTVESGQPFVDVYSSESLPIPFPDAPWRATPWTGGEPGNLVAVFRVTPELRTPSAVVSVGE